MSRPAKMVFVLTNKRAPDPTTAPRQGSPGEPPSGHVLPGELARAAVGRFYGSGGMAAAPDSDEERDAEVRAANATTRAHTDPYPDEGEARPEE
jgi:hypothetical protein